ncbi:MAG: SAP domain-containing protein [Bauldia litoralis]|uniref:SAP domain-containing protein n=1 Tax=Bauldia litoralis TaxID=665467 RepID=UPI00329734CA
MKGERVEKGTEIELNEEQVARFDPSDISPYEGIPEAEPEEEVGEETPLDEMSLEELKAYAKDLGLKISGSKADIMERITLHLEEEEEVGEEELPEE